jgi:hypothetical protein
MTVIALAVMCVFLYLAGVIATIKMMEYYLALETDEEFFFLSKKLDIIIIVFWPVFVLVSIVIELFGPKDE